MIEEGEHIMRLALDRACGFDRWRQVAVRGPEVSTLPEALGPSAAVEVPQGAQTWHSSTSSPSEPRNDRSRPRACSRPIAATSTWFEPGCRRHQCATPCSPPSSPDRAHAAKRVWVRNSRHSRPSSLRTSMPSSWTCGSGTPKP